MANVQDGGSAGRIDARLCERRVVRAVDHRARWWVSLQALLLRSAIGRERAAVAPMRRVEHGAIVPTRVRPPSNRLHLAVDKELPRISRVIR